MKKILYISFTNYSVAENIGVIKKIEGQKKAFQNHGFDVSHIYLNGKNVCYNGEAIYSFTGSYDFYVKFPLFLAKFLSGQEKFFLTYVRKAYFLPVYYFVFKSLYNISDAVLLELPVYPYLKEIKSLKKKLGVLFLDSLNNLLIKKYIRNIVTVQDYDEIQGIKTIKITNAYDFSNVEHVKKTKLISNNIRLITVANFSFWHGVDRVLKGLATYNNSQQNHKTVVEYDLVGSGKELPALKMLAEKLQLQGVFFHGTKVGAELDEIYKAASIGIGSLGLFRLNLQSASSLKNHEYCYYGIPFILGYPAGNKELEKFVFEVPNNDSEVDIGKLVQWYQNMDITAEQIQLTGKALYSWDRQIGKILNSI